jgi:hypothetical protein
MSTWSNLKSCTSNPAKGEIDAGSGTIGTFLDDSSTETRL